MQLKGALRNESRQCTAAGRRRERIRAIPDVRAKYKQPRAQVRTYRPAVTQPASLRRDEPPQFPTRKVMRTAANFPLNARAFGQNAFTSATAAASAVFAASACFRNTSLGSSHTASTLLLA